MHSKRQCTEETGPWGWGACLGIQQMQGHATRTEQQSLLEAESRLLVVCCLHRAAATSRIDSGGRLSSHHLKQYSICVNIEIICTYWFDFCPYRASDGRLIAQSRTSAMVPSRSESPLA